MKTTIMSLLGALLILSFTNGANARPLDVDPALKGGDVVINNDNEEVDNRRKRRVPRGSD